MEFIVNLLKQFSTWRGIIMLVSSAGLFTVTPEQADQFATNIVAIVSAVIAIFGLWDVIDDDKKSTNNDEKGVVDGLFLLIIIFGIGLGGSGLVKQEGKGLKIDKKVVGSATPVDYSKLNQ